MEPVAIASQSWPICDFNPFVIPAFSSWLPIRWYGVAYVAGVICGALLLRRWIARDRLPLTPPAVTDLAVAVAVGIVAGGRLGYCLFYKPHLWIEFGGGFPWWGVLRITEGGMASHGGIIGMAIATVWWWRRHARNANPLVLADAVAAAAPIGVVFGRLANFWNGELWGRSTQVPWGWYFPQSADPPPPADLHGEGLRAWMVQFAVPRHPSQLYAVFLEGLLILAIVLPLHARHRRPGLSLGVVLVLYAFGRITGEYFREPDAGQPGGLPLDGVGERLPLILGLFTKGQALTLIVAAVGIAFIIWALRRRAQPEAYMAPAAPPAKNRR
jgi:phosphatidylglycerol:prolipoprotein diacylglycerol transferase